MCISSHGLMITPIRPYLHRYEKLSMTSQPFLSGRKCVIVGIQNSGSQRSGAPAMDFDALFAQVITLLQREQRISYRVLKRRFALSDDDLADLKDELIYAKKLAVDEDNRVLVWTGDHETAPLSPAVSTSERASAPAPDHAREPLSYTPKHLAEKILTSRSALEGERKQVTVLFCD